MFCSVEFKLHLKLLLIMYIDKVVSHTAQPRLLIWAASQNNFTPLD
jgi:hypothetical protein